MKDEEGLWCRRAERRRAEIHQKIFHAKSRGSVSFLNNVLPPHFSNDRECIFGSSECDVVEDEHRNSLHSPFSPSTVCAKERDSGQVSSSQ